MLHHFVDRLSASFIFPSLFTIRQPKCASIRIAYVGTIQRRLPFIRPLNPFHLMLTLSLSLSTSLSLFFYFSSIYSLLVSPSTTTILLSIKYKCDTIGFDGGQRQWFRMEIYEQKTGLLQANISARHPSFIVSGLEPGRLLTIAVYAVNVKGHSDRVILEGFTLKAAEKQMSKFFVSIFISISIWGNGNPITDGDTRPARKKNHPETDLCGENKSEWKKVHLFVCLFLSLSHTLLTLPPRHSAAPPFTTASSIARYLAKWAQAQRPHSN